MTAVVRTDTPMNLLAIAVLEKLQGISHRKNAQYISTPRTIKRMWELGDVASVAAPALAVTTMSWELGEGASSYDGRLLFGVHCMVESKTQDPEGDLLKLVSDVMLALMADLSVGGRAIYLFPRSFQPNADLIARSGLAVTTITFECLYRFEATAP